MTTTCLGCERPLSHPDSIARQRGRVCQEKFEGDTHVTPIPRRMRRKRLPEDEHLTGFPDLNTRKDNEMSDEIARLLDDARRQAPHVDEPSLRAVVKSVLNTLDDLIDEDNDDGTWPDPGDLAVLAKQISATA